MNVFKAIPSPLKSHCSITMKPSQTDKNQSLSSTNDKYTETNQSLLRKNRQLQTDNARLLRENAKYEHDYNTMQLKWTEAQSTINGLRIQIDELKQKLQFVSDTGNMAQSAGAIRVQLSDSVTPQTPTWQRLVTDRATNAKVIFSCLSPPLATRVSSYSNAYEKTEKKANDYIVYRDVPSLGPAISTSNYNEDVLRFWLVMCDVNNVTNETIEYNRLYPWLCKVFIENTGCSRVPKSSDL
eukprot:834958_1